MSYPNYPPYSGGQGYPYPPNQNQYPPQQQPTYPGQPAYPPYPSNAATGGYAPAPGGYAPAPGPYPPAYGPQVTGYPQPQATGYPPQPQAPAYNTYSAPAPYQQQPYASTAQPFAQPYGIAPAGPPASGQYSSYPSTAPYASAPTGPAHYQQPAMAMPVNIPTVTAASPFDPRSDADVLHKAMKGLGTDEKSLINVLCRRTAQQRVAIYQAYKSGYGKDLDSKLKSELGGNLEKLLVALCLPPADFMAHEVHDAVCGMGTNESTLVQILCSGTNQEIREMNASYLRLYGHPMEKDIKGDTSGTLKMLLISLAQGQRDENQMVDNNKVKEDAQRLYQAGEAKLGTDESAFNAILATRSWAHLRQLMAEYQTMRGHSLEQAVAREFSANAEKGLLAILQCARNRAEFFANRLHHCLRGMGTKDRNLIRIIVTRCDIDLGNVKREYEKMFGKSLQADVQGDTSGDYKVALLTLIG